MFEVAFHDVLRERLEGMKATGGIYKVFHAHPENSDVSGARSTCV